MGADAGRVRSLGSTPKSCLTLIEGFHLLFLFHRWKAKLRILDVEKIKSVPYVAMSHPCIKRVIGTIRREYLDHVPFRNSLEFDRKLLEFKDYYNNHRPHAALSGKSPTKYCHQASEACVDINNYDWQQRCRGLFYVATPRSTIYSICTSIRCVGDSSDYIGFDLSRCGTW